MAKIEMKLSKQAVREFQGIYKDEMGQDISNLDAERLGINLLNLMKVIYKPIKTNEKSNKNDNRVVEASPLEVAGRPKRNQSELVATDQATDRPKANCSLLNKE